MDCAVVPALHSSCRLARGLEQNGCAGEKKVQDDFLGLSVR